MNIELIHELFYLLFIPFSVIGFSNDDHNAYMGWYESVNKKFEISPI